MPDQHVFFEKPPYTWPNPRTFPFRHYFNSPKLRIFLIDCIPHNWMWLSKYEKKIRDTDVFFVSSGWWAGPLLRNTEEVFKALSLSKHHFRMLCNDDDEIARYSSIGLQCALVNNNSFIDESKYTFIQEGVEKIYDAIYVGRRTAFKRHMLANKVNRLAVVAGGNHGNAVAPIPDTTVYVNPSTLTPDQVFEKVNQSHCGLILSAEEGACYASSEYLLCGVPVVSTESHGGRDVWYDSENAIVCPPNEDAIAEAVSHFVKYRPNPHALREGHIRKAQVYRSNFVALLASVFEQHGVSDVDPQDYFAKTFHHKIKKSESPDLAELFS